MKNLIALFTVALTPLSLWADAGQVPVETACEAPFTGSLSAGFESSYVFRGLDLGGEAPWMGIDTRWNLTRDTSLDLGAWYVNPMELPRRLAGGTAPAANDELDLYAAFDFPLWVFQASFGSFLYHYPEATSNLNAGSTRNFETNFALTYPLHWFDLKWFTAYDWNWNYGDGAWYQEFAASRSVDLSRCLTLALCAGLGHYDNYNLVNGLGLGERPAGADLFNGFSHAFVTLGLTWAMTDNAAFDFYVGGNFVNDRLESYGARGSQIHGGASVSVSF